MSEPGESIKWPCVVKNRLDSIRPGVSHQGAACMEYHCSRAVGVKLAYYAVHGQLHERQRIRIQRSALQQRIACVYLLPFPGSIPACPGENVLYPRAGVG